MDNPFLESLATHKSAIKNLEARSPVLWAQLVNDGLVSVSQIDEIDGWIAAKLVTDENRDHKTSAARYLLEVDSWNFSGCVDDLLSAANDDNADIRLCVCKLLKSALPVGRVDAIPILTKLIGDTTDARVQVAALQALKALGKDLATYYLAALKKCLTDSIEAVRGEALCVLKWLEVDAIDAVPDIVTLMLRDSEACETLQQAARALAAIDSEYEHAASCLLSRAGDDAGRESILGRLRIIGELARPLRHRFQAAWKERSKNNANTCAVSDIVRPMGDVGIRNAKPPASRTIEDRIVQFLKENPEECNAENVAKAVELSKHQVYRYEVWKDHWENLVKSYLDKAKKEGRQVTLKDLAKYFGCGTSKMSTTAAWQSYRESPKIREKQPTRKMFEFIPAASTECGETSQIADEFNLLLDDLPSLKRDLAAFGKTKCEELLQHLVKTLGSDSKERTVDQKRELLRLAVESWVETHAQDRRNEERRRN